MGHKAAVLPDIGKPLEILEVPTPKPGKYQALIKIKTCGLCHTDIHQALGEKPHLNPLHRPIILGHEGVGVVEEIGPECLFEVGERVGLAMLWSACGVCELCLAGWEMYCPNAQFASIHVPGTYQQYALVDSRYAPRIPKELDDVTAAPVLCGGITAYGAIRRLLEHGITSDKRIAIWGAAGGVGHLAVQVAKKVFGFREVVAVDAGAERVEFCKEIGADYAFDAQEAVKKIEELGKVYGVVNFAPSISALNDALRVIKPRGVLVIVAAPSEAESFIRLPSVRAGVTIVPSMLANRLETREMLRHVAEGRVTIKIHKTEPIEKVNQCFKEVLDRKILGRIVFTF